VIEDNPVATYKQTNLIPTPIPAARPHVAPFKLSDIEALVRSAYGIDAPVTPLPGEVDHNFLIGADQPFVLRLSPPRASEATVRFQVALARHLERTAVAAIVQRVVPNASGDDYWSCTLAGASGYLARSTTYLRGILQRDARPIPGQRAAVGASLAAIQLALGDFAHPEARHELMWDLLQAERVRRISHELGDKRFVAPVAALDDYLQNTLPALQAMRTQVCHNDLNGSNVLVDPNYPETVTGVLDFGDAIQTAAIADVAVGAAYNLEDGPDLLSGAASFVSGFVLVKALTHEELAILPRLILARLAIRIIITEWRAKHRPHNRTYILKNTPVAWEQFAELSRQQDRLEQQFRSLGG
jgi:Ser/Thr protein kinase RdoA (MazF antagonist)